MERWDEMVEAVMVDYSDRETSVTEAGIVLESWALAAGWEIFQLLGQMLWLRVRLFCQGR